MCKFVGGKKILMCTNCKNNCLKNIYLTFISSVRIVFLKVLNQFDFFASLISNKFCEKPNLSSIHCNMLAGL